jgi:dimethylamine/trimethylamine dehydrogenase
VLGRRGYRVHLIEKKKVLGGHLVQVAALPGLAEWFRVVSYRERQLRGSSEVVIMPGAGAATAEDLMDYGAEKIVLAIGAQWNDDGVGAAGRDPVPGIDSSLPGFVTPEQLFAGKAIGDNVAILDSDGYFMAVSLAELLADRGKRVTLITQFDRAAPYTDFTLEGPNLRRMMHEKAVACRVAVWVESAEARGAVALKLYDVHRDGFRRTEFPKPGVLPRRAGTVTDEFCCDTVVLCTGRRSNTRLWRDLAARRAEWEDRGISGVFRAGDCLAPRYIADAVFDGHRMGREIDSPDPQRPRAIIRERHIWGCEAWPKLGDRVL